MRSVRHVYIPTYGRMGRQLPPLKHLGKRAMLAVRLEELDYYNRQTNPMLIRPPVKHIGQTRHWIIENALEEFVWMIDDDVTTQNLSEAIDHITEHMVETGAALGCLGPAFMANQRRKLDGPFTYNRFGNSAWCVRRSVYLRTKCDMSQFATSEDLYCFLWLMTKGYGSVVSNNYICRKSNRKGGGCATYRTPEQVIADMKRLEAMFPKYYKVSPSRNSNQGYKFGVSSRVSWAKLEKDCIITKI